MKPIMTTFSRQGIAANNLLTVQEWRYFGRQVLKRKNATWRAGVKFYLKNSSKGGALVLTANDTLIVFTKLQDGSVRETQYDRDEWRFEN